MDNLVNINLELLNKDRSQMTHQEKMQYLRDLEYERLALRNHWSDKEKADNRAKFEEEQDRERKLLNNLVDILLGNEKNLTDFEKKQAEQYLEENPDIGVIFDGVIKMICEGRSDVENIFRS